MPHRSTVFGLLAASLLSVASMAGAQSNDLQRGVRLMQRAQFSAAATSFERVLVDPSATREDLVEAYRNLAGVRFALGRRDDAARAAAIALALDPSVSPPEGASPTITTMFVTAASQRHGARLHATIVFESPLVAGRPGTLRLVIDGTPPAFDARATLRCASEGQAIADRDERAIDGVTEIPIPGVASNVAVDCTATLSNASGALLERISLHGVAIAGIAPVSAHPQNASRDTRRGPNVPLIIGLTGAGAVVIAAAVITGVLLTSGQPTLGAPVLVGP